MNIPIPKYKISDVVAYQKMVNIRKFGQIEQISIEIRSKKPAVISYMINGAIYPESAILTVMKPLNLKGKFPMKNRFECSEVSSDKDGAYMRCPCELDSKIETEKTVANSTILTIILLILIVGVSLGMAGGALLK